MKSKAPAPPPAQNPLDKLKNNTAKWWWADPGMRKLSLAIIVGFCGQTQTGYDAPLIGSLLANPRFIANMLRDGPVSTYQLALIIVGASIGSLLCLIPAAIVADKWGRKLGITIGYLISIAGAVALSQSNGPWEQFGLRIVSGFGGAWVSVTGAPYCAEVCHPRNRAVTTALIQTCFYIGSILGSWVCFGTLLHIDSDWSWRLPILLQTMIPIVALVLMPFIEESPRWLIANGRIDEAHRILAKYHANGDMDDELVQYELKEILHAKKVAEESQRGVGYRNFFRTKGNRHRLLILVTVGLASQWVGNGIITMYIVPILTSVGITNPLDQNAFNGGLQIWNWFAAIGGAMVCEKFGRRFMWLLSAVGQLISYIIITVCSALYAEKGNVGAGYAVLAFMFIYFFFYSISFTGLMFAYPMEVLPNSLRGKGVSVLLISSVSATLINQFVNTVAFDAIAWRYYFVFIGTLLVVIYVMWRYFPETKGMTLEQVAEMFDGEEGKADKEDYKEDIHKVEGRFDEETGIENTVPELPRQ